MKRHSFIIRQKRVVACPIGRAASLESIRMAGIQCVLDEVSSVVGITSAAAMIEAFLQSVRSV